MARIRRDEHLKVTTTLVWNVALYIRLSREDHNDISISVENQKRELEAFLLKFEDPYHLIDYYCDDGYTGTDSNRINFQRLLKDVKSQKVNCVIVRDPSRLSRNYLEAGMYMEQLFVQCNVRFISLSLPALDSYKNPDAMNSIAVPIQNVINDDFCRQTSQKVRGVFQMKRLRGDFIGAFAPYGYQKSVVDKNTLVVDNEASNVVKNIYNWYVYEGLSVGNIARELNKQGIANPTKYKQTHGLNYHARLVNDGLWSPRTIASILANEMYVGHMIQGKQKTKSYKVHDVIYVPQEEWIKVENTHEAIIDASLFKQAQLLHKMDTRTAPKQTTLSLFAGYLKCADCGKGMRRSKAKGRVYYHCRTNSEKSLQACTRHSIREDILEEVVLKAIQLQLAFVTDIQSILDEIHKSPLSNPRLLRLEKALKIKESELSNTFMIADALYMDWKMNSITETSYLRMKEKFEAEEQVLKQQIEDLKEELSLLKDAKQVPSYLTFLQYNNVQKLDRAILVCFIDKIKIHEDRHVSIQFKYTDPYR